MSVNNVYIPFIPKNLTSIYMSIYLQCMYTQMYINTQPHYCPSKPRLHFVNNSSFFLFHILNQHWSDKVCKNHTQDN